MTEPNKLVVAAAIVSGYLLGRTKKGRLAATAAVVVLGRGLRKRDDSQGHKEPKEASRGGTDDGEKSHGEIVAAGRAALTAVMNKQLNHVTEALHEKTMALQDFEPEDSSEDEGREEEEAETEARDDHGKRRVDHAAEQPRSREGHQDGHGRRKQSKTSPTSQRRTAHK